jgi:hypothetical protein
VNDKQQLQAMGEEMQQRLQECAKGAAKTQEQRDQLAAKLEDATAQCGVMAELVNRMVSMMVMAGDEAESGSLNPVKAWMFDAQEALAGKLPEHALAMPEGWRLVEKKTCFMLLDGNDVIATLAGPRSEEIAAKIAMLAAAPKPQGGE